MRTQSHTPTWTIFTTLTAGRQSSHTNTAAFYLNSSTAELEENTYKLTTSHLIFETKTKNARKKQPIISYTNNKLYSRTRKPIQCTTY